MIAPCPICGKNEASSSFDIVTGRKQKHNFFGVTETTYYQLIPVCPRCSKSIESQTILRAVFGVFSIVALFALISSFSAFQKNEALQIYALSVDPKLVLLTSAVMFVAFAFLTARSWIRRSRLVNSALNKVGDADTTSHETSGVSAAKPWQIPTQKVAWLEAELVRLNRELHNEERPPLELDFLQRFPKVLLEKDDLTAKDIETAVTDLVSQTKNRIGSLDVPFRKPRVILTTKLPTNEPGHIEFGNDETLIRIHPKYVEDPFALASILCHEIAHFILDHNGIRKSNVNENEKLTDFFVFKCGQGLIYLQGILDVHATQTHAVETKLGYLSLEEMAYAHVRCSSQYGLEETSILPNFLSPKLATQIKAAIKFLSLMTNGKTELAEMILCPNNHVLRISRKKPSSTIRCPKCDWRKEIWLRKKDESDSLVQQGRTEFDAGKYSTALEFFRKAQSIVGSDSHPYCLASRCLKKLGRHQDAIREIQKFLTKYPEDASAQEEMKGLIYR